MIQLLSKRFIQTPDRKHKQMYKWFKTNSGKNIIRAAHKHSVQISKGHFFDLLHPISTEKGFFQPDLDRNTRQIK